MFAFLPDRLHFSVERCAPAPGISSTDYSESLEAAAAAAEEEASCFNDSQEEEVKAGQEEEGAEESCWSRDGDAEPEAPP